MSRGPRFVKVGPVDSVPDGQMREVVVEDVELVVVNCGGELRAFANRCPHQGGPLAKGRLEDGVIWCPWHLWQFDAKTGRSIFPEGYTRAARYPLKIEDGQILVDVG